MSSTLLIASDHAGFDWKTRIQNELTDFSFEDLGCHSRDAVDYPIIAQLLCQKLKDSAQLGILICGSGQGMAIAANRHSWIRASLGWNLEVVRLSREHNNANVLCLGARIMDFASVPDMIRAFATVSFAGGRHQRRLEQIACSRK